MRGAIPSRSCGARSERDHQPPAGGDDLVHRVEEFFLGRILAGDELDVVDQQQVGRAQPALEADRVVFLQRADELDHELLGRHRHDARARAAVEECRGRWRAADGSCRARCRRGGTSGLNATAVGGRQRLRGGRRRLHWPCRRRTSRSGSAGRNWAPADRAPRPAGGAAGISSRISSGDGLRPVGRRRRRAPTRTSGSTVFHASASRSPKCERTQSAMNWLGMTRSSSPDVGVERAELGGLQPAVEGARAADRGAGPARIMSQAASSGAATRHSTVGSAASLWHRLSRLPCTGARLPQCPVRKAQASAPRDATRRGTARLVSCPSPGSGFAAGASVSGS